MTLKSPYTDYIDLLMGVSAEDSAYSDLLLSRNPPTLLEYIKYVLEQLERIRFYVKNNPEVKSAENFLATRVETLQKHANAIKHTNAEVYALLTAAI
jgi:hypothetical protein